MPWTSGTSATTCKRGGDVVVWHNTLRDVLAETCHRAHLGIQVEAGNDPTADHSHTHPADLLLTNWTTGKTAAFDISAQHTYPYGSGSVFGISCPCQWRQKAQGQWCKMQRTRLVVYAGPFRLYLEKSMADSTSIYWGPSSPDVFWININYRLYLRLYSCVCIVILIFIM